MAELQNELEAAGAGIIWVLEADESLTAGTADSCVRIMSDLEASRGWCVGDGQTMPTPGAFDESPFSEKRGFDMIVALSSASQKRALELTKFYHLTVDYWPIMDPTGIGETREQKLNAYRQCRDQIIDNLQRRFGPPVVAP